MQRASQQTKKGRWLSSFSDTTGSSSSQKLGEILTAIVDDDSDEITSGRRRAAFLDLEQLLLTDQEEAQTQADNNAKLLSKITNCHNPIETSKRALDVFEYPQDLAACACPYPLVPALVNLKDGAAEPVEPIIYPISANEHVRLAAIEHFRLHDMVNLSELNVICTLAAAEMGCPHSVVTLVEKEVVTLLATNAPDYWDLGSGNPREQTFCQHFVMEDKPLLVRHAESDMRFYHIAPVVLRSLQFYAGFTMSFTPVLRLGEYGEPNKVVFGTLCCLDEKPHEMTRSQYWRLTKLAEAASTILERNAKQFIADPTKYTMANTRADLHVGERTSTSAPVTC
ncbi:hypothetical protein PHMEG_0007711 [Phytophthora megakarya]|uniref:GAF domain-containing protein n=1 Tax=Phytophthora megakarya TaxID=4795 RepID=A0A225WMV3_9STRA|nr:hypothetical protein PHMEG_0007711 [Phytophthora megakarya]